MKKTGLINNKCNTRSNFFVYLFFALFLIYGLIIYDDYMVSPDESTERTTGLINYKYAFGLDGQIGNVDFSELADLSEWRDRYYGSAAQYIPILLESFTGFTKDSSSIYLMRHLYTFLIFWVACICFYILNRHLNRTRVESLIVTAALILSPRILADSFYNIKDSVFLSLIIMNLLAGLCFLEKPGIIKGVILSIISAICVNVRIIGGEVVALILIVYFIDGLKHGKVKKRLGYILLIGSVTFGFYILITPITWNNTFESIKEILLKFSNYTSWTGLNFYNGESLQASELPWHYLLVWIIATTPVLYLIMAFIGIAHKGCTIIRTKTISENFSVRSVIIGLYVAIPIIYVVIRHPALYDGWRHFYFIYPGILLIAVSGWHYVYTRLAIWWQNITGKIQQTYVSEVTEEVISVSGEYKIKNKLNISSLWIGMTVAYLAITALWIVRNHPYEYVYFNSVMRGYASENLERDYWHMAQNDALDWILNNDDSSSIKVSGGSLNSLVDESLKDRVIEASDQPDYLIYSNFSGDVNERFDGYYMEQLRGTETYIFDGFDLYDDIYHIDVDGMRICTVYRREYNKNQGSQLKISESNILCEYDNVSWVARNQEGLIYIEGALEGVYWTDRLGLQSDHDLLPVMIQISEDGEEWISFTEEDWEQRGYSRIQINNDGMQIGIIRLIFDAVSVSSVNDVISYNLGFYNRTDAPKEWADRSNGIKSVYTSENTSYSYSIIDGYLSTRWDSGTKQVPGIYCMAELSNTMLVGGITIDYGKYRDDIPAGIIVEGSQDGEQWIDMNAVTKDGRYYTLDPMEIKYIRVSLTADSDWYWSVCEMYVWVIPDWDVQDINMLLIR